MRELYIPIKPVTTDSIKHMCDISGQYIMTVYANESMKWLLVDSENYADIRINMLRVFGPCKVLQLDSTNAHQFYDTDAPLDSNHIQGDQLVAFKASPFYSDELLGEINAAITKSLE